MATFEQVFRQLCLDNMDALARHVAGSVGVSVGSSVQGSPTSVTHNSSDTQSHNLNSN